MRSAGSVEHDRAHDSPYLNRPIQRLVSQSVRLTRILDFRYALKKQSSCRSSTPPFVVSPSPNALRGRSRAGHADGRYSHRQGDRPVPSPPWHGTPPFRRPGIADRRGERTGGEAAACRSASSAGAGLRDDLDHAVPAAAGSESAPAALYQRNAACSITPWSGAAPSAASPRLASRPSVAPGMKFHRAPVRRRRSPPSASETPA